MRVTLLSLGQSVSNHAPVRAERHLGPLEADLRKVNILYEKNVDKFVFRLYNESSVNAAIVIKREGVALETHDLQALHGSFDGFIYETKSLSRKTFGQLNLGFLELELSTDQGLLQLKPINFALQDFSKKNLNSVYQVIADSNWLDLFSMNASNSMLPRSDYDDINSNRSFWLVYSLSVKLIEEAEYLLKRNKLFLTVVQE